MANKKKKKNRGRHRGPVGASPQAGAASSQVDAGLVTSSAPAALTSPASQAPAPARPAYASGVTGPRRQAGGSPTTGAAIDIDARVPYFASDLRRVLITAGVMVLLVVAGSLLIH